MSHHSTTVLYWISFTVCTHMRDFEVKTTQFVCVSGNFECTNYGVAKVCKFFVFEVILSAG